MLYLQISLTSDTAEPHIRHQNTVQRQGSQSGGSELISHQDNDKGCQIHHGQASKKSNTHIHKPVGESMHSSQVHVPNDTPDHQSCYVIQLVWVAPGLKHSPPTSTSFSPRYHTCRADVFTTSKSITLLIKWAKNIQTLSDAHIVNIPSIPSTTICPMTAYAELCALIPTTSPNQPLLSFPHNFPTPHPIVNYTYLTQCLRSILIHLGHDPSLYSWHSFRRGGAGTAFQAKIPLHLIKQQGAWRSKAVLKYTSSLTTHQSSYAQPLISHILHSLP